MEGDLRLTRLSRLLHQPIADADAAAAAMAADPAALGDALFADAVENDDVISIEAAAGYVADRLDEFGELVSPEIANAVRDHVRKRLRAWE